jgi:hypothetical protein
VQGYALFAVSLMVGLDEVKEQMNAEYDYFLV